VASSYPEFDVDGVRNSLNILGIVPTPSGNRPLATVVTEMGILQAEKAKAENNIMILDTQIMVMLTTKKEVVDKITKFNIKEKSLYAELCQLAGLKSSFPILPNGHSNSEPVAPQPVSIELPSAVPDCAPSTSTAITNGIKRPASGDEPQQAKKAKAGPKSVMDRKAQDEEREKKRQEDLAKHASRLKATNASKRLCQQPKPPATSAVKRSQPVRPGARPKATSTTSSLSSEGSSATTEKPEAEKEQPENVQEDPLESLNSLINQEMMVQPTVASTPSVANVVVKQEKADVPEKAMPTEAIPSTPVQSRDPRVRVKSEKV
jgi:hypothetical protein